MTRTLINTLTIPVATHSTMKITNVVCSAHLNCTVDLISLCQRLRNCRYEPRSFPSLIWQHRNIGGNCLVFAYGVINSNGKASSFREGRKRLCRYARLLQKYGCPVYLTDAKIITVSASHTLSGGLDLYRLAGDRSLLYEREIFPALNFKIEGVNFCCFHIGKVVITGIKTTTQIDDAVYPTLIELELYVREK